MEKSLFTKASSLVKNKWLAIATLLLSIFGVIAIATATQANAKDVYGAEEYGTVYQRYMLAGTDITDATQNQKILKMGSLGSGGVSGQFSYGDIIASMSEQGKEGKRSKAAATGFATAMATYSKYNYLTYKPQGFGAIVPILGHFFYGLILLIFGFLNDIVVALYSSLVGLLQLFNVIPMLSNAISHSKYTNQLLAGLGLDTKTIQQFSDIMLSVLIVSMLLALYFALYRGASKADKGQLAKARNRLFSIVALPVVIIVSAGLINTVMQASKGFIHTEGSFTSSIVDDRSWAFKSNLAPLLGGSSNGVKDFNKTHGYIDTTFNPYLKKGTDMVETINKQSDIVGGNDNKGTFKNTALAYEYLAGNTFNANDFLGYKMSAESKGQPGSIYDVVHKGNTATISKHLADVSDRYPSSDLVTDKSNVVGHKKDPTIAEANYGKAIKDYAKSGKLRKGVTPTRAWADRFIYGYKNSGDKLEDYYKAPVSAEQLLMNTGNNASSAFALSDESAFFALNTQFNADGGKYLIDAPARGILATKAQFDSNRADYYTTSIVGIPLLTVIGMISSVLLTIVVLIATVIGIMSLGFVDMNKRPLMAWIKGMTLGDIEYAGAFFIYAVGITGTILTLTVVPNMIVSVMNAISKAIVGAGAMASAGSLKGLSGLSPNAGLVSGGFAMVVSFVFALAVALLFWRSQTFRDGIVYLIILPWAWARQAGQKLENKVSSGNRVNAEIGRMNSNNKGKQLADTWINAHNGDQLIGGMNERLAGMGANAKEQAGAFKDGVVNGGSMADGFANRRHVRSQQLADKDKNQSGSKLGNALSGIKSAFTADDALNDSEFGDEAFLTDGVDDKLSNSLDDGVRDTYSEFKANPTQKNANALSKAIDKYDPDGKKLGLPDDFTERLNDGTGLRQQRHYARLQDVQNPAYEPQTGDTVDADGNVNVTDADRKQIADATFDARQALAGLSEDNDVDDDLIRQANDDLDAYEANPTTENLHKALASVGEVKRNVKIDGKAPETVTEFETALDGMNDTEDIAKQYDQGIEDARQANEFNPNDLNQTLDEDGNPIDANVDLQGSQDVNAKVSDDGLVQDIDTIDNTSGVKPLNLGDNVDMPQTDDKLADGIINADSQADANVKEMGTRDIDATVDDSGVQDRVDTQGVGAKGLDLSQADTNVDNPEIADQTIDAGNSKVDGTRNIKGQRNVNLTDDQSGVQDRVNTQGSGAKGLDLSGANPADIENPNVADQTVDAGNSTTNGTRNIKGQRNVNLTDDQSGVINNVKNNTTGAKGLDLSGANPTVDNPDIADRTVDAGNSTANATQTVKGQRNVNMTTDQSGVRNTVKNNTVGAKGLDLSGANPADMANDQQPTDRVIDNGNTSSKQTSRIVGNHRVDNQVIDETRKHFKTGNVQQTNRVNADKQILDEFNADQSKNANRTIDGSGTTRGKAVIQGERHGQIDLTDATKVAGSSQINRTATDNDVLHLDESQLTDAHERTADVETNRDESRQGTSRVRGLKGLFGKKNK